MLSQICHQSDLNIKYHHTSILEFQFEHAIHNTSSKHNFNTTSRLKIIRVTDERQIKSLNIDRTSYF